MAQMFRYPNLLRSSRRRFVFVSDGIVIGSVAMRDGVVGDYQRVTLDADAKDWAYVYVCGINAAGNVPEGTELVLSCFVRVDGGPKEARPTLTLVCGDGTEEILKGKAFAHESVGGGGRSTSRGRRGTPSHTASRSFTSDSRSTRLAPPSTSRSLRFSSAPSPTHGRRLLGRCGRR